MFHSFCVYGGIAATIYFYLVIGFVFEAYSKNLMRFIDESTSKICDLRRQDVGDIRQKLNLYFQLKYKAESITNILPFLWLSYVLLSSTSHITKEVIDWDFEKRSGEAALVVALLYFVTYKLAVLLPLKLRGRSDRCFQDSIQKLLSFKLKTCASGCIKSSDYFTRILLNQEIVLLHKEIYNSNDMAQSTVMYIAPFNEAAIVSFMGHIINFSVMVINIRIAFNTMKTNIK